MQYSTAKQTTCWAMFRRSAHTAPLLACAALLLTLAGCVAIPANVTPVENFQLPKYLGKWYEIARLDHSFERGLTKVTADYSLRDDGGVQIVNRGYSAKDKKWQTAAGKAYFVKGPDLGFLKVSFFGPFYGSYVVFDLDQTNYQHALVCGPDTSYFWILAREPQLDDVTRNVLLSRAAALGFATNNLIYPQHD